ncbi:Alpha/Beta hydrolase protein [Scleroderma yunnanense]
MYYTRLAEIPLPTAAHFIASNATSAVVRVTYSIRDHERNTKRQLIKTFTLSRPESDWTILSTIVSHESSDIQASALSSSKTYQAILREICDSNEKKRFVEVWTNSQLVASLDVTKHHGPFHTDDFSKSLSFSPSETAFIYTAEANPDSADDLDHDPYRKFRYNPHFGEGVYTKKRPILYIFRWREPTSDTSVPAARISQKDLSLVAISLCQPPVVPVFFGQASFATETQIFATGYEPTADGRILGIKACFNRPSSIWELCLPSQNQGDSISCIANKIEIPGRSSRSPRILFDEHRNPITVLWLSNPTFGAHASTVSLYSYNLMDKSPSKALLSPDQQDDLDADSFPGLYTEYNLIESPFIERPGKGPCLLAQSVWHSRTELVSIAINDGHCFNETHPSGNVSDQQPLYNWSLLASDGHGNVVCSRSTPTSPPEVVLLTMESDGCFGTPVVIDEPVLSTDLQQALKGLSSCIIPIPDRHPTETVVIQSKGSADEQKPTCVTVIHGGPHTTSTVAFTPLVLALALEGYTISMPNYTGSMGFGERYIQKLVGQCGTLDVGDCMATVKELIRLGISDEGRQVLLGGSHGGFLTVHLIGQYPGVFSAVALRNPVISVGEIAASDIPDWAYAEFGLPYGPGTHITPELYAKLYAASPIAHVDKVCTPVLLLIGEDDLRVPPSQGKGFYHALKGRGRVPVEMLMFPKESHPLEGVEATRVCTEAARDWFGRFVR